MSASPSVDSVEVLLARIARIDDALEALPGEDAQRQALSAERSALKAELAAALARSGGGA
jgi:hypothetical protein